MALAGKFRCPVAEASVNLPPGSQSASDVPAAHQGVSQAMATALVRQPRVRRAAGAIGAPACLLGAVVAVSLLSLPFAAGHLFPTRTRSTSAALSVEQIQASATSSLTDAAAISATPASPSFTNSAAADVETAFTDLPFTAPPANEPPRQPDPGVAPATGQTSVPASTLVSGLSGAAATRGNAVALALTLPAELPRQPVAPTEAAAVAGSYAAAENPRSPPPVPPRRASAPPLGPAPERRAPLPLETDLLASEPSRIGAPARPG